jgi:DNA-binding CsgD family transcriptional regulator
MGTCHISDTNCSSTTIASASKAFAHYPGILSSREVEVLRLVTRGLTDAQNAERMVLSPHIVTTHLTSIYGKSRFPGVVDLLATPSSTNWGFGITCDRNPKKHRSLFRVGIEVELLNPRG